MSSANTGPGAHSAITAEEIADAFVAAEQAATASGVELRAVESIGSAHEVATLFGAIWGRTQGPPVTPEMLRAMSKAGSYLVGAYRGETLVGASLAFHEEPELRTLHSHITGVIAGTWRNVGFALKVHQRAWALARGIERIAWTYDPLVGRNAYFNITKLGAVPVEYLENFYGNMADALNGTDDTDRLLVHWDLRSPDVAAACHGHRGGDLSENLPVRALVVADQQGAPVAGVTTARAGGEEASIVSIAVPQDASELRAIAPQTAREWRVAVRQALLPLIAQGARVISFDRAGHYLFTTHAG